MTSHTVPPPSPGIAPAGFSSAARSPDRNAALIAGVGLLVLAALAAFAKVVALDGLVTPGDAARTATDISASLTLFRSGIVSVFAVVALDVLVAWALYRVFARVDGPMSLLAAWLRLAYAAVFLVAAALLLEVPRLLDGGGYVSVFPVEQRQAQALASIDAFGDVWNAALVLFGLHLLVLGYLAYRSRFVPRALGVLLAVAGAGYVVDSIVAVVAPHSVPTLSTVTFLGEFLLAVCLVTRGRRVSED
jgi:hypothetical protein